MSDVNLATIRVIDDIQPIEGADRIEKAVIGGWNCVVKKDEFKPGDACVFCELDSIVPATKPFEFLGEHRRLKTKKLRGVISQGLALPITMFAEELSSKGILELAPGTDLTEAIGVKKYVKEIPPTMQGLIAGNFPSYVPKTDEEQAQNCREIVDVLKGVNVYISNKLDGTSATYVVKDGVFHVCSRNWEKKRPVTVEGEEPKHDIYWDMAIKYNLEVKMLDLYAARVEAGLNPDFAVQGEIMGEKIQGNILELTEPELFLFNVFWIGTQEYCSYNSLQLMASILGVKTVPILREHVNMVLPADITVAQLLEMAKGNYSDTTIVREGIVIRAMESYPRSSKLSFKAINNDYLLLHGG